jgi:Icc protein
VLIAQITDCHMTAEDGLVAERVAPASGLQRAIDHINSLGDEVALVIGTGDLVNDGAADEYDQLERLLGSLTAPWLPIPGNHDDRTVLRERFAVLPHGGPDDPIDHVIDHVVDHVVDQVVGSDVVRIVCLDTTIAGRHDGRLTPAQLAWLDRTLAERRDVPVLIAQHHPPFASGIESMDRFQLAGRDEEEAVVRRHAHVAGIVAGHYHRTIVRSFGGTVAFACPSTAVQLDHRLGGGPTTYSTDPPALALHSIEDGALTTHVVQLADVDRWSPSWAE